MPARTSDGDYGAISGATCCTNLIPNGETGRKSLCRLTILSATYEIGSTDTLENRLYLKDFGRSYAAANAYLSGTSLDRRSGEHTDRISKLDYNYVGETNRFGGQWSVDTGLLTQPD